MAVILAGAKPPLQEVAKLGAKATQIYGILWESALMDVDRDDKIYLPYSARRDCGGTTHWSKSALASHIGSKRETVSKALDTLLDNGFITIIGLAPSQKGSPHAIYRVLHPNIIESQRHVISLFPDKPSVRWKNSDKNLPKDTSQRWPLEPSDWTNSIGWDDESRDLAHESQH